MRFSRQNIFLFFFVSLLSSVLLSSVALASFNEGYVRNEFTCSDPFSFRYLGLVQGDPGNGIGPINENEWVTYFSSSSQFTTTCLPGKIEIRGDADEDDNGGIFFGGFLYVVEDQNSNQLTHRVRGPYRNAGLYSDVSYILLQHSGATYQPLLSSYTSTNYQSLLNEFSTGQSLYVTNNDLRSTRDNTQTSSLSIPRDIPVGFYFIQGGLDMRTGRGSATRDGFAELEPVRFGTQTTQDTDANLNNIANGYVITNRPLEREEMDRTFGARVEELPFLCGLAGGEHEIATDADGNDYGVCCGNTLDDEGDIHTIGGSEDRCIRQTDGSFTWLSDQAACEAEPALGSFNVNALVDYQAVDGSDGCCGDDPNDYGYITPDGQYFCNRDALDNDGSGIVTDTDQDAFNYYWDKTQRFQVHVVDGTDFISNGNQWHMCAPQDTTLGDELIGTLEIMDPPRDSISNFDTCLGGMNYLLDQGLFSDVPLADGSSRSLYENPNGAVFSVGQAGGSWVCTDQVDNNMDGFFSLENPNSCIRSCYTAQGRVSDLFLAAEEFENHFCVPGFNIIGCPNVNPDPDEDDGAEESSDGFDDTFLASETLCENIRPGDGNRGFVCSDPTPTCLTGQYYSTIDTDIADGTLCCKAQAELPRSEVCLSEDTDVVFTTDIQETYNPSEQFLCHQWNAQERFIECCPHNILGEENCNALNSFNPLSLYQGDGMNSNGLFATAGGSNYLVEDFNTYENGELKNKYLTQENIGFSGNELFIDFDLLFANERDRSDWTNFGELHFSVRYTADLSTNPYQLTLTYDTATQTNQVYSQPLANHLVTGTSPNKFQHAIILLPQGITRARSLRITTTFDGPGLDLDIDHLYLSEHNQNYPEFFCSGNGHLWLDNLDGPTDDGFAADHDLVLSNNYRLACTGAPSFAWTGNLCCGDDTDYDGSEIFNDGASGCYQGNIVYEDESVALQTRNLDHANLLYAENTFYYCTTQADEVVEELISTHGNFKGEIISQTKEVGDLVAGHACSDTGTWIDIGSVSKTKELASYMYSIISEYEVFGLHCQTPDTISPLENQEALTYFIDGNLDAFCGAQIVEDDRNKSLLGFTITDTQDNFMGALAQYLELLQIIEDTETFTQSCSQLDFTSEEEFYICAVENNQEVRVLVHQEKPIYIVTYLENANDFGGLLGADTISDFIDNALYFFSNLFSNLFGENDEIEQINNPQLPTTLASSTYDVDSVVIQAHQLENETYKMIIGFIEEQDTQSQVVVEYSNFYTSVEPFAERYYGEDEAQYQLGENSQLITFTLEDAQERAFSFEPPVDWRRITSALRIDDSQGESFLTAQLGNGQLDIGEACDSGVRIVLDDEGNEVEENFTLYRDIDGSSCEDYARNIYGPDDGELSCLDGEINLEDCNYCGDGYHKESEEACDDGNNNDGDGCSETCQIEVCGDGILTLQHLLGGENEACDDGNIIDEGYQAISCNQANNCNAQCSGFGGCIGDSICQAQELDACRGNIFDNLDCVFCDVDGDGYPGTNDCDDTDSSVHDDCRVDDGNTGGNDDSGFDCNEVDEFTALIDCENDAASQGQCRTCQQLANRCFTYVETGLNC